MARSSLPTQAPTTGGILASFSRIFTGETVTLRQVLSVLGDRGLASALLIVTIPQFLPLPLGLSNVLAVPMVLVAAQMALGRHTLWLPKWLLERPVPRDKLVAGCERVVPLLRRVEKLIKPRASAMWSPLGMRLVGIGCFVITCVSVTPLPLTGWLPALAVAVTSLGLLERDGRVVVIGLSIGAAAVALLVGVTFGLIEVGERVAELANGG